MSSEKERIGMSGSLNRSTRTRSEQCPNAKPTKEVKNIKHGQVTHSCLVNFRHENEKTIPNRQVHSPSKNTCRPVPWTTVPKLLMFQRHSGTAPQPTCVAHVTGDGPSPKRSVNLDGHSASTSHQPLTMRKPSQRKRLTLRKMTPAHSRTLS